MWTDANMYDRLHAYLTKKHLSVTPARDAVFWSIKRLGPCQIGDIRKEMRGSVSRAALYRTLRLFLEIGVAEMIRQDVIRLKPPFATHAHYMLCRSCGRQISFNDEELEKLLESLAASRRLSSPSHQVEIVGQCDMCQVNA